MNTLKGVFPEPRQPPKRNFLKENMANIKQMQDLMHSLRQGYSGSGKNKPTVFRRPPRSSSNTRQTGRVILAEKPKMIMLDKKECITELPPAMPTLPRRRFENSCCRTAVESLKQSMKESKPKARDVAVQTEQLGKRLNEQGGAEEVLSVQTRQRVTAQGDQGDVTPHKRDYVKENAQVCHNVVRVPAPGQPSGNAPPGYKKGVVPRYLRERKEELCRQARSLEGDEKCPEGHVMLPDTERKETLRMLRQSYAELVTELNMLPVRSDTLKVRNRKVELENQLKKLDEGIKVFTRPKVYVQIGA